MLTDFPRWSIIEAGRGKWLIKVVEGNVDVPTQSVEVYKDTEIALSELHLTNGNVYGYSLDILEPSRFKCLNRAWYIQVINKTVTEHSKPKEVYSNKVMYLYRFNGKTDGSYWLALRKKEAAGS